jgi:hypothetical protein
VLPSRIEQNENIERRQFGGQGVYILDEPQDAPGGKVGYKTLLSGYGRLFVGNGPLRTGVTAILPRGTSGKARAFGGFFPAMASAAVPRGWR